MSGFTSYLTICKQCGMPKKEWFAVWRNFYTPEWFNALPMAHKVAFLNIGWMLERGLDPLAVAA